MKMMNVLLGFVIVAFGCSREMRLPTDPIAPSSAKPLHTTLEARNGGVQSATGHVDQTFSPFGVVVINQYSFSAVRTPSGRVNGQFEFRAKYLGLVIRAHGDVECLRVNGNKAHIAGRVTQSTFEAGIPTGSELTWNVTDNGEPGTGRDTASQLLGAPAQAYCASPFDYPESVLRRGNVQVRQ